jgi:hypothetical protein
LSGAAKSDEPRFDGGYMSSERWSVEIVHPWYVRPSDDGSGFALCVHRGIACEGHTQATTAHDFGQVVPGEARELVSAVVEDHKESLTRAIGGFVEMQSGLSGLRCFGVKASSAGPLDGAAETIGYAFQCALLRFIVAEALALAVEKRP